MPVVENWVTYYVVCALAVLNSGNEGDDAEAMLKLT